MAEENQNPPAIEADTTTERGERKVRTGVVMSAKMEKTVIVSVSRRVAHPIYGKVVQRTKKFKAHDEIGCAKGDTVEMMETRRISKDKHFRITRIIERAK